LVKGNKDPDAPLSIEVSKLSDDEIDEQIEQHQESIKVAELRRQSAEEAAKRIQEEDAADDKAKNDAKKKKEVQQTGQDYAIETTKLEEAMALKPNKDITNKLHETVASLQKVKTKRAEAKSLPKPETSKSAQSSKP